MEEEKKLKQRVKPLAFLFKKSKRLSRGFTLYLALKGRETIKKEKKTIVVIIFSLGLRH